MSRKGFTLIELLVVVAVLALLASIVFSNLGGAREGARISNALSFQSQTHSLLGSDLVGWWNFNDPSDRYKDLSGYGNNGSCTSCPTPVDGVPGTGGMAMEFDGVGDYIRTPRGIQDDFTISFWFKTTETGRGGTDYRWYRGNGLVDSEVTGVVNDFGIAHHSNGYIIAGVGNPDIHVISSSGYNNGNWHYVSFARTRSTGGIKLYINGTLVDSDTGGTQSLTSAVYTDIARIQVGNNNFNGLIDDIRIYSRALTASEVQGLYARTKDKYLAND